ncbi:fdxN element excision controlling factor protein [Calothrix sp. NIES-3974]|nr:fdxN element excision controlling factor protein [Calothrix sp. NIES-3974]
MLGMVFLRLNWLHHLEINQKPQIARWVKIGRSQSTLTITMRMLTTEIKLKQALLKDDWVITADPLKIKIDGIKLEIDLAAEKVIAAQKAGRKIAVEIKSFLNASVITVVARRSGRFRLYRGN